MKQILDCPKCKAMVGFAVLKVYHYMQYYQKDGTPDFAEDVNKNGTSGKRIYCSDCGETINKCIEL